MSIVVKSRNVVPMICNDFTKYLLAITLLIIYVMQVIMYKTILLRDKQFTHFNEPSS